MGRISIENAARYDDVGVENPLCYYCNSEKVRGYDYIPLPLVLEPEERGKRVRACVNCLPRLHYHIVVKNNYRATLEDRKRLLGVRRITNIPVVKTATFTMKDGIMAPADMSYYVDGKGVPAQYFVLIDGLPTDLVNRSDLEAAQLCIGATLLGLRSDLLESAWSKLAEIVPSSTIQILRKRLVESP